MPTKTIKLYLLIASIAIISACGGGGGGSDGGGDPTNYTVGTTTTSGGSIGPSEKVVEEGNTTAFTITPDTGFSLNSVTGCGGTLTGDTYTTAAITGDCTVTATFLAFAVWNAPAATWGNISWQ